VGALVWGKAAANARAVDPGIGSGLFSIGGGAVFFNLRRSASFAMRILLVALS
jgi:hypothetical protein